MRMKVGLAAKVGWAAAIGLALVIGCSVPTSFSCSDDRDCGLGQCIAGGCAFVSDDCPSGLRFGELSPAWLAGQCVGVDEGVAEDTVAEGESSLGETTLDTSGSSSMGTSSTGESSSSSSESSSSSSESSSSSSESDTSGTTGSLPDTVIAHYGFDELDPPVIFDSSGNGHHAEMDNLQMATPAIVGEGLAFANLDRVIVPLDVLAGRTEFTIEFYMQVTQPAPLRQFVVYYGDELDTAAKPNLTVYVEYSAAPQQTARVVWTAAQATGLIGTTALRGGQWHHVAVTFDGQGMRVYVDHFLDDDDPLVPNLLDPNLAWIQIGGLPTGFGSFTGVIDELRFSEGALTPDQMQPVP